MGPIERSVASGSKSLGVLPRYQEAADGGSIVTAQGEKIRRVKEGVEIYTGAGQTPAKYNRTAGGCGVMVIWTRISR